MGRLGLERRPTDLAKLQAVAAVGQAYLIEAYDRTFRRRGHHAAQVLLTAEDLDDRTRYLNVRNTILMLLEYGAVPVVNENDTVATDEIRYGDNDRLAAQVAVDAFHQDDGRVSDQPDNHEHLPQDLRRRIRGHDEDHRVGAGRDLHQRTDPRCAA